MEGLKDLIADNMRDTLGLTRKQEDYKHELAVTKLMYNKLRVENDQLKAVIRRTAWELDKASELLGKKGE